MLVEHDVEAELVGNDVLVEIAVVEVGADLGIEQAARDRHPRVLEGVERRQVRVGHFREVPGAHACCFLLFPPPATTARSYPRNLRNSARNACGCSRCGRWPACGITAMCAPGMSLRYASP